MSMTDKTINVEVAQDPVHGDWSVSMYMCHTPRRIYVANVAELGTSKNVHIYVERKTCHIEERRGDWYCTECGEMVGASDPTSELFIDGNAIEMWEHCPKCGAEVIGV